MVYLQDWRYLLGVDLSCITAAVVENKFMEKVIDVVVVRKSVTVQQSRTVYVLECH